MACRVRLRHIGLPLLKCLYEMPDLRIDMIDVRVVQLHPFPALVNDEFAAIVKVRPIGYHQVSQFDFLFVACADTRHGCKSGPERFQKRFEVKACLHRTIGGKPGYLKCEQFSLGITNMGVVVIKTKPLIKNFVELYSALM